MLQGCGQKNEAAGKESAGREPAPPAGVVEIRAVGKTFEGPSEIPSGWTTFKFVNASSMIHFGLIDVPPEGITSSRPGSANWDTRAVQACFHPVGPARRPFTWSLATTSWSATSSRTASFIRRVPAMARSA